MACRCRGDSRKTEAERQRERKREEKERGREGETERQKQREMREREGRREERYKVGYLVCVREREAGREEDRETHRERERALHNRVPCLAESLETGPVALSLAMGDTRSAVSLGPWPGEAAPKSLGERPPWMCRTS